MPQPIKGEIVPLASGAFAVRCLVGRRRERALFTLVGCANHDDAKVRGAEIASLVSRLRRLGLDDDAAHYAEQLAKAPERRAVTLEVVSAILAGRGDVEAVAPSPQGPTFRSVSERWVSGELAIEYPMNVRAKRTAADDESRLRNYIWPLIGGKPIGNVTIEDYELVVRSVSAGSRRHVAQLVARVLALAVYPLKLLKVSPLPRGILPRKASRKALSCLFVDEEAKLMAARSVPLANRVLYAFLHREGLRASEALDMEWRALDLVRGLVRLDRNKTNEPRRWNLDPSTREALLRWRTIVGMPEGRELVFGRVENKGHLADSFREHLKKADVTRDELFERTAARQPIRLHDTRAGFVSTALACDKAEGWISARTGHKSSTQINAYRRLAQTLSEIGTSWFSDMASGIPELDALGLPADGTPNGGSAAESATARKVAKVDGRGLEPLRVATAEPKSAASANSATRPARFIGRLAPVAIDVAVRRRSVRRWPTTPTIRRRFVELATRSRRGPERPLSVLAVGSSRDHQGARRRSPCLPLGARSAAGKRRAA
ncbi:hypothetical protein BH11MYX4_BH11MYX4_03910 [soil metagenome]